MKPTCGCNSKKPSSTVKSVLLAGLCLPLGLVASVEQFEEGSPISSAAINALHTELDGRISDFERIFQVTQDDRVGIGVSDPLGQLDVLDEIHIVANDTGRANLRLRGDDGIHVIGSLPADHGSDLGGHLGIISQTHDKGFVFMDGGEPLVLIDSSGGVGIGITEPESALHVDGNIRGNTLILKAEEHPNCEPGRIRYTGTKFQGCTNEVWVDFH